jgi:hypothetical protein
MSVLKIHLTYQCSAQCDHCHLRAGQQQAPAIPYDLALRTIADLQRINGLNYVVLLGGEPGLVPDLTHALASAIHKLGIGVRIETNASWATDEAAAQAFLAPLCAVEAQIMLSVDAFHEPYVRLDCVERAIRVLDQLDGDYVLEVPYLDFPQGRNPLDARTKQLLCDLETRLGRTPCARTYQGPVFFKGRAAHKLAALVADGRGVPSEVCDVVPWWSNGSQRTLDLLGLDPEGYLSKECGIAIGNVRRQSVAEIVHAFDAEKHPVLSTLIHSGPLGLAQEAREYGYTLKPDYADKCHLCQEAREHLREKYAAVLVPDHHYVGLV